MSTHTLSVLVSNKPGVLARVAGLISRRGFNIESLAVGPTDDPDVSRMTIVTNVDDEMVLEQIVKQLNKLIEVYKILELESNAVTRQMMLVKVRCSPEQRNDVIAVINLFRGHAVDVATGSITVEATGTNEKLNALLTVLEPYGVVEIVQSGQVALGRGLRGIDEKNRPALAKR